MKTFDLPTQFIHEGKLYGPGKVEIDDSIGDNKRVCDDLEAAVKRHEEAEKKGQTSAPINTVLMQTMPEGQKAPPPTTATGQTPAELAEAQAAAGAEAAKKAKEEEDKKKAEEKEKDDDNSGDKGKKAFPGHQGHKK